MYDYTLKTTFKDGRTGSTTYQSVITKLGVSSHKSHGRPLSDGGLPQVQVFISMLKDLYKEKENSVDKIVAYYQGEPVLSA